VTRFRSTYRGSRSVRCGS